jgi:hypothetical protein
VIAIVGWSSYAHAEPPQTDCVWPAAGGATAGLALAWYGFAGVEAARGRSVFDLDSTPGNVALSCRSRPRG